MKQKKRMKAKEEMKGRIRSLSLWSFYLKPLKTPSFGQSESSSKENAKCPLFLSHSLTVFCFCERQNYKRCM